MRALLRTAWVLFFWPSVANCFDPFEAVKDIQRAIESIGPEAIVKSIENQQSAIQTESKELSKVKPTPETNARKEDLKDAKDALINAKEAVNGKSPPSLKELRVVSEIIRTIKNPVWVVCGSDPWFKSDPDGWNYYFSALGDRLPRMSKSVGIFTRYFGTANSPNPQFLPSGSGATGFVIGRSHVLTNRHVLEQYAYKDETGWHFIEKQVLRMYFPLEYSKCERRIAPRVATVVKIELVGEEIHDDYAILKVEAPEGLPEPLEIARDFNIAEGGRVVAIGYPSRPIPCGPSGREDGNPCTFLTAPQIDGLFGAPDKSVPFPAQRFSPGIVMFNPTPLPDSFSYDSSTWGGNSGSPVVSLVDGLVVGVHYQGIGGEVQDQGYNNAIATKKFYALLKDGGFLER